MGRMILPIGVALLLAACSGKPGAAQAETAIENAWKADWLAMGKSTGVVTAEQAAGGATRGMGSTARKAVELADRYGGVIGGGAAREVIDGAAGLARDFGVEDAKTLRYSLASAWQATNVEVIDSRASGNDYVIDVRYDIAAVLDGRPETIKRDVSQRLRLSQGDDGWMATPIGG